MFKLDTNSLKMYVYLTSMRVKRIAHIPVYETAVLVGVYV